MTTVVDIFADFAINDTKSKDGVWVPYRGDVEFLLARSGNKNFRKQAQALMGRNRRVLDMKDGNGNSTDEAEAKLTEIMIEIMAQTVLLGWKGNLQFQGNPLEYSVDNAKKLLKIDSFRDMISGMASDEQRYKEVQEVEEAKNSEK